MLMFIDIPDDVPNLQPNQSHVNTNNLEMIDPSIPDPSAFIDNENPNGTSRRSVHSHE